MHDLPVLITGTSTGFGRSIALDLCQRGFHVFAGARKLADAEALEASAEGTLTPLQLDVVDERSIANAVAALSERTGGRLYALINNAGVAPGGPLETMQVTDIRNALEVNVAGPFVLTRAALPLLRKNGGGRIINIGSISGLIALPGLSCYAATKHALEAFTDSLRVELSPFNISVSIVEPGNVMTPIWDKAKTALSRLKETNDAEVLKLYAPLIDSFGKVSQNPRGIPVEKVVRTVARAVAAPKPRNRYLLGRDAMLLKAIGRLPDALRDTLLRKAIG